MNKDPENSEIGEIFQESYKCEVITWKIPIVSSLEISEITVLRSPWFSYKGAIWILSIYPRGRDFSRSIQVKMERLHSEIPKHTFFYKVFFKRHDNVSYDCCYESIEFDLDQQIRNLHIFYRGCVLKWYSMFFHNRLYRRNNMITLVIEILIKKEAAIELDSKTKSVETVLGSKFLMNEDFSTSVGELSTESFDVDIVAWKIPKIRSIPVQVDTKVQSPAFHFAGVFWILKLFPYGQTKFKGEKEVDVIIERLQFHVQKNPISYLIFFESYDENKSSLVEYFRGLSYSEYAGGSFIFDLFHTQENILSITSLKNISYFGCSNQQTSTVVLISEFRSSKKSEIGLSLKVKSVQPIITPLPVTPGKCNKIVFGEIIKESFDCEAISWTISSVTSLLNEPHNAVRSPLFSFKGVNWRLQISYSHMPGSNNDCWKIVMQCLLNDCKTDSRCRMNNPQVSDARSFFCRIFFRSHGGKESDDVTDSIVLNSNQGKGREARYVTHTFDIPFRYIYKKYRHNDTLTLVCEIYDEKTSLSKMNFKSKSSDLTLGNISTKTKDSIKQVGELYIESFEVTVIKWKIPTMPMKVDYGLISPCFIFANVFWILKMFPYGQKKFESESKIDVVIESLESPISEHSVLYKIFLENYDKNWMKIGYYFKESGKSLNTTGSFIFSPNYLTENICNVASYSDFCGSLEADESAVLICDLRIKLDNQTKYDPSHTRSTFETSSKPSAPFEAFTSYFQESSQKLLVEPFAPFESSAFSFKGSLQKTSKEESFAQNDRCYFKVSLQKTPKEESVAQNERCSFKGSLQKTSKEEPVAQNDACSLKGSIQKTLKEEPVVQNDKCSFKGSIQKISKEEPVTQNDRFSFKGSLQKTSNEERVTQNDACFLKSSLQKTSKEERVTQNDVCSLKSLLQKTSKEEPVAQNDRCSLKGRDDEPGESVEVPSKKFLSDMRELFLKQEDCDVILKVKGQEFPAHRLILKAHSPVFASTFKYDTTEKATGVIDIEDCDPSSFLDFLYFLYCGTAEKLSSEKVFNLFTAADKYDVQDLRSECMKFMKNNLSIDNFCDTITLALKHSERELIELTTDFFRKNLQKIILTVKWQSFLIENPIQGNELLIKALSLNKT